MGEECANSINKKARLRSFFQSELRRAKAEEEGFEPPVPLGTLVFKTSAFNRSAIPPVEFLCLFSLLRSDNTYASFAERLQRYT